MKNEIFEKEFKQLLNEVADKYKDVILDDDAPVVTMRKMEDEIYDYMYDNVKMIDSMTQEQIVSITRYAIELGSKFKDPNLGRSFWYSGVCFSFESLPMEK